MIAGVDNNSCLRKISRTEWPTSYRTLISLLSLNLANQLAIKTEVMFSTLPSHHSLSPLRFFPARTPSNFNRRLPGRPKISYQRHRAQETRYLRASHPPVSITRYRFTTRLPDNPKIGLSSKSAPTPRPHPYPNPPQSQRHFPPRAPAPPDSHASAWPPSSSPSRN